MTPERMGPNTPVSDELLSLAMDAADEVGRSDEGDYRARHALMDFVAQRPGLIVRLIENEDDRMSVLAEDLRKTKVERDKLLPFVLVRCPKCREFMMPDGEEVGTCDWHPNAPPHRKVSMLEPCVNWVPFTQVKEDT